MNTLRTLGLAVFLTANAAGTLLAQTTAPVPGVDASAAGHWLYSQDGSKIGSVRSLSADGRSATIMIGSYFQPGSHEAEVSVSELTVRNGKVTLQRTTMQALNATSR